MPRRTPYLAHTLSMIRGRTSHIPSRRATSKSDDSSRESDVKASRKSVKAYYGSDYFATRRSGGGMIRAAVFVPHEHIGSAGFSGNVAVSVMR